MLIILNFCLILFSVQFLLSPNMSALLTQTFWNIVLQENSYYDIALGTAMDNSLISRIAVCKAWNHDNCLDSAMLEAIDAGMQPYLMKLT